MAKNTSAFPKLSGLRGTHVNTPEYRAESTDGMTLRDYFAAKAMQAVLGNEPMLQRLGKRADGDLEVAHEYLAAGAYSMADKMLAERDKGRS